MQALFGHVIRSHQPSHFTLKNIVALSMMFMFLLPMAFSSHNLPAEAQTTTCTKSSIQLSKVSASGNDGNVPQRTVDGLLTTRWSNPGLPSWIQYDFGIAKTLCYVDIDWYRGQVRENSFTISISSDKVNFKPILTTTSDGVTSSFERYNVPDTVGRYVRITVTDNSENNYASISEVALYTKAASTTTTTTTHKQYS